MAGYLKEQRQERMFQVLERPLSGTEIEWARYRMSRQDLIMTKYLLGKKPFYKYVFARKRWDEELFNAIHKQSFKVTNNG